MAIKDSSCPWQDLSPGSIATPLFEKVLSATDTDLKLSRLFIPKTCAETFFPDLCGRHGMPISILDTEGKQWEFFIRCWPNPSSKTYVLEGLRDYIIAKKWQAGDIVTFCQTKPGGKLMMGLRKTSTGSASSWAMRFKPREYCKLQRSYPRRSYAVVNGREF